MKTFVCALLLVAAAAAEPPRYRLARFQSERQVGEVESAPYPAAGFKPDKEFKLPSKQELSPPATNYGVPENTYGAPFNNPQTQYGVPRNADKENKDVESVAEETQEKKGNLEEPKKDAEVVNSEGSYYVLLPGSQLQRVQFQTENDLRNMAYTARLQYRSEDRAPVFVYSAVPQYQPSAAYVQLI